VAGDPTPAGVVRLAVDARDARRKLVHATLQVPARPGPLTLLYPKWLPGEHGPTGPIANLTGLRLRARGQALAWTRDPGEMFAVRCEVPAGSDAVEVELDMLLPSGGDFTAGRTGTDRLLVLSWNTLLLYPQGQAASTLRYDASVQLPDGWDYASALPEARRDGATVHFETVSLERLVDSPLLAGAHLRRVALGTGTPSHELAMAAEDPAALALPDAFARALERVTREAGALFGARHYGHYLWLLSLSPHVEHFGLEHHESSDNRMGERTLLETAGRRSLAELLSHEFVHSWNGKFRRPAGLATPDYQTPMRSELLWVYEGLTQYLGSLLPVRAGLWTAEEWRERLALVAAQTQHRAGRAWRPLADTATAAQVLYGAPPEWASWRREVDFYDESVLIWLEADGLIREASAGRYSLDDFCKRFHGGAAGPYVVKPYTRQEVLDTLSALAPHDWNAFFTARVESAGAPAPLAGLERGGWRLTYDDTPNVFMSAREAEDKLVDETFSIGLVVREDGSLQDVIPGLPAANAGLGPGMKLLAVDGRRYTPDVLHDALAVTPRTGALELLVENNDFFHTHRVQYAGGRRYPHLVRDAARPDGLARVIAALVPDSASERPAP
jgi:predicted metalloprotease with PDZ domain